MENKGGNDIKKRNSSDLSHQVRGERESEDTDFNIFHKCKNCKRVMITELNITKYQKMFSREELKLKKGDFVMFARKNSEQEKINTNYLIDNQKIFCKFCENQIGYCVIKKSNWVGVLSLDQIESDEIRTLRSINKNQQIKIDSKHQNTYITTLKKMKVLIENIKNYIKCYYKAQIMPCGRYLTSIKDKIERIRNILNTQEI